MTASRVSRVPGTHSPISVRMCVCLCSKWRSPETNAHLFYQVYVTHRLATQPAILTIAMLAAPETVRRPIEIASLTRPSAHTRVIWGWSVCLAVCLRE